MLRVLLATCVAWLVVVLCCSFPSSIAALSVPQAISSNMVLQRGPQQARVWGVAAPGSVVSLMLDSAQYKTFASSTSGEWTFDFPAQPASVDRTLSITGDGTTLKFSSVAFGDVFICSGQSNMEMAVSDTFTANESITDAGNYPHLHLFGIQKKASTTPLNDTINRWTDGAQWVVSAPKYVGGGSFNYFSAVCFYFGRSLYKALNTGAGDADVIPIGLVDTVWGGTRVEAWTTQDGLDQCGPVQSTADYYQSLAPTDSVYRHGRYQKKAVAPRGIADLNPSWAPAVGADPDPNSPMVLYNGMIAPIINMRVVGATWYQGTPSRTVPYALTYSPSPTCPHPAPCPVLV
jgi:sialate O-acetylesterase